MDEDTYPAGEYQFIVKYRFDDFDEGYYKQCYSNYFYIRGALPAPTINVNEGRYLEEPRVEADFWNYRIEIELKDAEGNMIFSGSWYDYDASTNMQIGYRIRARAIVLDNSYTYYTDSPWSDEYVFEGIKLEAPWVEYNRDTCSAVWYCEDSFFIYTLNGGEQYTVGPENAFEGQLSVLLNNGDVIRIKRIASDDQRAEGYADSDWTEYTCTDTRQKLLVPTNLRVEEKMLIWDAVEGAEYYLVEISGGKVSHTAHAYENMHYTEPGCIYRIRAISNDTENYKPGDWSESFTYSIKLPAPIFSRVSSGRIRWYSEESVDGYRYRIGEDGEVQTTTSTYISDSLVPLGSKLYVQAYKANCYDSDWAMIYSNNVMLATPNVTVLGGTASWEAIENAEGYLYRINGGDEVATNELSVTGLKANDTITVCATSTQIGYDQSEWSELKTQLPSMSAPVINTENLSLSGTVTWEPVDGATSYEYDIDGVVNASWEMSVTEIQFGQSFKVRAICDNGEYEQYGEWCEAVVREDTREQLTTPIIAYDPEIGLTVAINDPRVSYYEAMFGQDGYKMIYYPPDGAFETEVITNSFAFPENDHTVYVKAVSKDGNYRDSEWATIEIIFE